MLPLLHGLLLTAERPFFPADVMAALDQDRLPGILVTTPVHLRALADDSTAPGFGSSARAGFVLSATAPLSDDLARRTEDVFGAPVFEIYGCSEAGQLATRRTIDGPVWRTLDGFRLYRNGDHCWAAGPAEPDVRLADEIEPVSAQTFALLGRTADLVNIAGKRSSSAISTQQLLAIDGVQDGVFLMPPPGETTATPRLEAVVAAPNLSSAQVLARLRERIDPAFLPRPLHMVDRLPRNDLGKLPREELLRLIRQSRADAAPILIRFPADHPTGPDHFPGNPIIPGAVLLDELMALMCPERHVRCDRGGEVPPSGAARRHDRRHPSPRRRRDPLRMPDRRSRAACPVRRREALIPTLAKSSRGSTDWSARREIGSTGVLRLAVLIARRLGRPLARLLHPAGLPRLPALPCRGAGRLQSLPVPSAWPARTDAGRGEALLHLRDHGAGSDLSAER